MHQRTLVLCKSFGRGNPSNVNLHIFLTHCIRSQHYQPLPRAGFYKQSQDKIIIFSPPRPFLVRQIQLGRKVQNKLWESLNITYVSTRVKLLNTCSSHPQAVTSFHASRSQETSSNPNQLSSRHPHSRTETPQNYSLFSSVTSMFSMHMHTLTFCSSLINRSPGALPAQLALAGRPCNSCF